MKGIFIIALVMLLVLSTALFTGCSDDVKDTNDNTDSQAVQGDTNDNTDSQAVQEGTTDSESTSDTSEGTMLSDSDKIKEALAIFEKINIPDNFSAEESVLIVDIDGHYEYTLKCEVEDYNSSDVKYKGEITTKTEDGEENREIQEADEDAVVGPIFVVSVTEVDGIEKMLEEAEIEITDDLLMVRFFLVEGDELRDLLEGLGIDEDDTEMKSMGITMSLKIDEKGYPTEINLELIPDSEETGKGGIFVEGRYSDFK